MFNSMFQIVYSGFDAISEYLENKHIIFGWN